MHNGTRLLLPLLATAALAACGDGTGSERADVRVLMSRGAATASVMAAAQVNGDALTDRVALSAIDSLSVTVTAVEALRPESTDTVAADSAGKGKRGWVTIDLPAPLAVNLLGLPTDTTGGFQLVRGTLLPGTYSRVRLVVADSAGYVVFKQPVTVGRTVFPAGQRVPVEVPSSKIRTAISFTVGADSTSLVRLVFDPSTTVRDVTTTGSGRVKISPVLRAKVGK